MQHYIVMLTPRRENFLETILPSEQQIIEEHFYYYKELVERKKMILAGRCNDASFGIAIINADNDKEANSIVNCDPAIMSKVFTATIHPFSIALLANN